MKYLAGGTLFLLVCSLINFSALAQGSRNYISVSSGYSLPVGKFAKAKPDDPLSGLAGSGFYVQGNYDRRVTSRFGFRISGDLNKNKTNSGPIVDKANTYTVGTGKTYTWNSNVSKWNLGALLLGPAVYLDYGKLTIEGHIQGGIVTAKTPSVRLVGNVLSADGQIDPASKQIIITMDQKTVTPFGFAGGISLRYPIYKMLFVNVNADMIGARAQVKNLAIHANVAGLELTEQLTDKRFIGVVNLGAGLGIAF
ncbi:hypothetical protein [Dyadobacter luticola]|uniref:Outer membrane protein beta-barrel domain-containing protein n=1 Tax=Dyadobacter luticola TaxID=1979387 RepID=A0A5R9L1G3_9BACT|nr:hypothetical protein [Dyadobacter luticola]TLV02120.1 hypothetical protein FEN17_00285 [Dyadobacter luticola]